MTIEGNPQAQNPHDLWTDKHSDELVAQTGHHGSAIVSMIRKALHIPEPKIETRVRIDTVVFMKDVKNATSFKEFDEGLVVTEDTVGFIRVVNGKDTTYKQAMEEARKRGQNEATSYGIGKVGRYKAVEIFFNWEFMGASSGVVTAEKITRAMDLARKQDLPVVVWYTSGGQRQQEGAAALLGMDSAVHVMNQFKDQTNQPLISVLVGNVWGGVLASAVPRGDLIIGVEGTNYGFAGPGVIESHTGKRPGEGVQTIENSNSTNRVVNMVLSNKKEVLELLEQTISVTKEKNGNSKFKVQKRKGEEVNGVEFDDPEGFTTPFQKTRLPKQTSRSKSLVYADIIDPKTVYDQHLVLRSDPRRPDTLYILRHGFDWYVPLFSGLVSTDQETKETKLQYPGIIAALAAIDDPRLGKRTWSLVLGNQPSYLKSTDGKMIKVPASPTAWDFRYQVKMMKFGARLGLPAISFVDTFGASPTEKDELDAQYEAIADCLDAKDRYPNYTQGYLLGMGGSGGALATLLRRDYLAGLSGAQLFVAEPRSAAAIVYPKPDSFDVKRTAETMRPDIKFLLDVGIVDKLIPEPDGGAQNNPLATTLLLRENIIQESIRLSKLTREDLMSAADFRIRNLKPIPIGYLDTSASLSIRATVTRFFRR